MTQPVQPFISLTNPNPAVNYGADFDCTNDLNPALTLISGRLLLAQALYHRLITPRGGLFYDPNYGLGIQSYLNAGLTAPQIARIGSLCDAEYLKDDRVIASQTIGVFAAGTLTLTSLVTDGVGPFPLVASIASVSTALLTPSS